MNKKPTFFNFFLFKNGSFPASGGRKTSNQIGVALSCYEKKYLEKGRNDFFGVPHIVLDQ